MLFFLDIDGVMVPAEGWKIAGILSDSFLACSAKANRKRHLVFGNTNHPTKFK